MHNVRNSSHVRYHEHVNTMQTLKTVYIFMFFTALSVAAPAQQLVVGVGDGKAGSYAVAQSPDGGALLGLELTAGPKPGRKQNAGLDLAPGQRVAAVAAYTAQGRLRWSRAITATDDAPSLRAITVAADGSSFVAGWYRGKASVSGELPAVQSVGATDVFVLNLAANGKPRWLASFGGEATDTAVTAATAPAGGCYIAGGFRGTARFGEKTLNSHGADDSYLMRLDATGNVLWAIAIGGAGNDDAVALAAEPSGGVYLLLHYTHSLQIDTVDGMRDFLAAGGEDALVLRFDADGRIEAAQSIGSDKPDHFTALAADDRGVAVVGYFSGPEQLKIGEQTLDLSSQGGAEELILRLNAALVLQQHVVTGGGNGTLLPFSAAYARDGHLWTAGSITGEVQVGKEILHADRTDGVLLDFDTALAATPRPKMFGGKRGQELFALATSGDVIYAAGVTSNIEQDKDEHEDVERRETLEPSAKRGNPSEPEAKLELSKQAESDQEEGKSRSQAVLLRLQRSAR